MFEPNRLKRRLSAGEVLCGAWIETGSITNVEILGSQGFDFLLIDLEHGQGDLGDAIAMLRAARAVDAPVIIRVPSDDPVFLKRILDAGASSIMVPNVETPEQARAVVSACRYPPAGRRGYAAPIVRASGYGATPDYRARANDDLLIIVQIESAAAVAVAGDIAAVDGVDVPFLGVNDMAGSIGRLEQLDHSDVRALVAQAERAMAASGKPMGTVSSAGATWQQLIEAGYQLLPLVNDVALLRDAARAFLNDVTAVRAARPEGRA